ncbi:hypothetical protein KAU39_03165 [bacterium]|nr:hypothetical protein [bacterium]
MDNEGIYPTPAAYPNRLNCLMPKYIEEIPYVDLGAYHSPSNAVGTSFGDNGTWIYVSSDGFIYVECSHTDLKGTTISTW